MSAPGVRVARRCACMAFALLLPATASLHAREYAQAPGSTLAFAGEFDGEVFTGRFPEFHTRVRFDPAAPGDARIAVDIPLASVDTGSGERDDTLRSGDFFSVVRFPEATWVAEGVQALGEGRYRAEGTLTLRGVSRPVPLEFTWTPGDRPVLEGRATVSRLAFGVGGGDWADTGMLPDAIAVSTRVVLQHVRP